MGKLINYQWPFSLVMLGAARGYYWLYYIPDKMVSFPQYLRRFNPKKLERNKRNSSS